MLCCRLIVCILAVLRRYKKNYKTKMYKRHMHCDQEGYVTRQREVMALKQSLVLPKLSKIIKWSSPDSFSHWKCRMFSHPLWKGLEEKTVIVQLPSESITPLQHPVLHRVACVIPFGSGPLRRRGHHYPMSKEAKHGEVGKFPVAVIPRLGERSHSGQPGTWLPVSARSKLPLWQLYSRIKNKHPWQAKTLTKWGILTSH